MRFHYLYIIVCWWRHQMTVPFVFGTRSNFSIIPSRRISTKVEIIGTRKITRKWKELHLQKIPNFGNQSSSLNKYRIVFSWYWMSQISLRINLDAKFRFEKRWNYNGYVKAYTHVTVVTLSCRYDNISIDRRQKWNYIFNLVWTYYWIWFTIW